MTRLCGPSRSLAIVCSARARACSTIVVEKEERYTYSENMTLGGTVSRIWTSEHAEQNATSSGNFGSSRVRSSSRKRALASGVAPSERKVERDLAPHDRQASILMLNLVP